MNRNPVILYRYEKSGHCHRVQLMLSLLEIPHEIVNLERDGSNQPEDFLEISPMGQVPVINDNGFKLADSNAILIYLVKKYDNQSTWLPDDAESAARVQRWLSMAAGELVSGPAIARFSKVFNVEIDYEAAKTKAENLFAILESALAKNSYLTGNTITIADIACYTYVAHAPEGGLKLDAYPQINSWLACIESQPGFIAMASS